MSDVTDEEVSQRHDEPTHRVSYPTVITGWICGIIVTLAFAAQFDWQFWMAFPGAAIVVLGTHFAFERIEQ